MLLCLGGLPFLGLETGSDSDLVGRPFLTTQPFGGPLPVYDSSLRILRRKGRGGRFLGLGMGPCPCLLRQWSPTGGYMLGETVLFGLRADPNGLCFSALSWDEDFPTPDSEVDVISLLFRSEVGGRGDTCLNQDWETRFLLDFPHPWSQTGGRRLVSVIILGLDPPASFWVRYWESHQRKGD